MVDERMFVSAPKSKWSAKAAFKPATKAAATDGLEELGAALAERLSKLPGKDQFDALQAGAKERANLNGAKLIRSLRTMTGASQQKLADAAGIRRETVSELESMRRESGPALWSLIALARAAGFDLAFRLVPAETYAAVNAAPDSAEEGNPNALADVEDLVTY